MNNVILLVAIVCAIACGLPSAHPLTAEEIALLDKPDRQKILEQAAKKEVKSFGRNNILPWRLDGG